MPISRVQYSKVQYPMGRRNVILIAAHQHAFPPQLPTTLGSPSPDEAAERRIVSEIRPMFNLDTVHTQIIISPLSKEATDSALLAQLGELRVWDKPPALCVATSRLKPEEKKAYGIDPGTQGDVQAGSKPKGTFTRFTTRECIKDIVFVSHDTYLLEEAVTLFCESTNQSPKTLHVVFNATQKVGQNTASKALFMMLHARNRSSNAKVRFYAFGTNAAELTEDKLYANLYPNNPPEFMKEIVLPKLVGDMTVLELAEAYLASIKDNKLTLLGLERDTFTTVAENLPIVVLWDNDGVMTPRKECRFATKTKAELNTIGAEFEKQFRLAKGSATPELVSLNKENTNGKWSGFHVPPLFLDGCV